MNKIKSWNTNKQTDCFGNNGSVSTDHIWPLSKGGSNNTLNKIKLTIKSNSEKSDKTKGKINEYRFAIRREVSKNNVVYGVMMIKKAGTDEWFEITD